MTDLKPLDLLDLEAQLTGEERQIRDLAREWVRDRILPEVEDWYERGEFPARELAKELGELGFFGMQLPGIGDLGAVAYGLVELELEAGDSVRSYPSRARSRCTRSTRSARTSRRRTGCRGWRAATRSDASVCRSPTAGATPAR
jgi:Acyl-CoA dehydrogenase, N-terminal domain